MEKSGVTVNSVFLGLRKVTVMSQKEVDHPLILKPPAQNISKNTDVKQRMAWTREEISYVLPYELQNTSFVQKVSGLTTVQEIDKA